MSELLRGKKVAVLVETEYIPAELNFHKKFFEEAGAEVHFLTYLWGKDCRTIVSDVTEPDEKPETLVINRDIKDANPNDYAIIITAANYVACRLREIPPMGSFGSQETVSSPSAVRFITSAMMNPNIVKGFLCHALWLLTPVPHLLKGRKVICHTVVLSDVLNAGGVYVPNDTHVVVDKDLVTARSAQDLEAYGQALLNTYERLNRGEL